MTALTSNPYVSPCAIMCGTGYNTNAPAGAAGRSCTCPRCARTARSRTPTPRARRTSRTSAPPGAFKHPSRFAWEIGICMGRLYGRAGCLLNPQKRRFPAPRAAACLVHCLLSQKVASPRSTILNRLGQAHLENQMGTMIWGAESFKPPPGAFWSGSVQFV
jgi:hypothetical protein